jgi:hypothetical protein
MPAPVLGLPALLQSLATIGVGGAIGYKAQKSLKDADINVRDFEEPELRMLRALLMPSQAIGSEIKEALIQKKEDDKQPEKEQERSFEIVTKPMPKKPEDPEPPQDPNPVEEVAKDLILEKAIEKAQEPTEKLFDFIKKSPFGFTTDLEGNPVKEGFVVAETKLTEIALPQKELTLETVKKYAQNLKRLSDATDREIKAGGWFNEDDGKYYLDGPVVYDTLEEALYAGDAGDQIAIYDLGNDEQIDTKEGIKRLKEAGTYNSETADVFRRNREKLDKRLREVGVQDKGQSDEE